MIIKIISDEPLSEEVVSNIECCAYSDGTYPKKQLEVTLSICQATYLYKELKKMLTNLKTFTYTSRA